MTVSCFRNKTENSLWENHCDLHWGNQGQHWGSIKKKCQNVEEKSRRSQIVKSQRRNQEGWQPQSSSKGKADCQHCPADQDVFNKNCEEPNNLQKRKSRNCAQSEIQENEHCMSNLKMCKNSPPFASSVPSPLKQFYSMWSRNLKVYNPLFVY